MILQLLLNLVFTAMLCGLIWLVQLVHYPGFLLVGAEKSIEYQRHHTTSISWIVIPLMLAELCLAIWLLLTPFTNDVFSYLNYCAFACLVIIWLATFGVAVPIHNKLTIEGYKPENIRKLIRVNWIRTIFWNLRLLLLFYLSIKLF
jgi:hypothetical protein